MKELLKPITSQSFFLGLGVAAVAYMFGPQIKQSLRPLAVKGTQGLLAMGYTTQQAFNSGKEKLGKTFSNFSNSEVNHEINSDSVMNSEINSVSNSVLNLNEDFIKELREDKENTKKMIDELKSSISSLRNDLSLIKQNGLSQ